MKTFATQQINVGGLVVPVDAVEVDNPTGIPAIQVTATYNKTSVQFTATLAPVDGNHATLDPSHVQNALDEARLRVAKLAILKDSLASQLASAQ